MHLTTAALVAATLKERSRLACPLLDEFFDYFFLFEIGGNQ
jgi:hypothetical protein